MDRIIKWVVVLGIIFLGWKYGVPWVKERTSRTGTATAQSDSTCVSAAERASENWGSGLRQFINPPYDVEAWSGFQRDVESAIQRAEVDCRCAAKSCETVREAMRDLRNLVAEMGTAIRTGSSPPSDAVQRQEAIDNRIASARALLQSGQ